MDRFSKCFTCNFLGLTFSEWVFSIFFSVWHTLKLPSNTAYVKGVKLLHLLSKKLLKLKLHTIPSGGRMSTKYKTNKIQNQTKMYQKLNQILCADERIYWLCAWSMTTLPTVDWKAKSWKSWIFQGLKTAISSKAPSKFKSSPAKSVIYAVTCPSYDSTI